MPLENDVTAGEKCGETYCRFISAGFSRSFIVFNIASSVNRSECNTTGSKYIFN